ncbi:MAG: phosphatidylglycerophosphatase A [Rhodospirillales bacterium]|nr:phosphatidylglycerophosphatase A [Alphaproteobacteria bacterium]MBL6947798.1 phosphatidylglycerophosphatase A [Rhodospirillales bacterium]
MSSDQTSQPSDPPKESPKAWNLAHPAVFLATGFGSGLLPRAPGTWGSLLAVGLAWGIVPLWGTAGLAVAAALAFALGIWAANVCIEKSATDDPKQVVIDEIAGQWLVLLAVPPGVMEYALGFVLFRAFDIFKPWPVSWADKSVKGGLGVMLDDVLAAGYAMIVLYGVTAWLGN